jgi:hypothetical protein
MNTIFSAARPTDVPAFGAAMLAAMIAAAKATGHPDWNCYCEFDVMTMCWRCVFADPEKGRLASWSIPVSGVGGCFAKDLFGATYYDFERDAADHARMLLRREPGAEHEGSK